MKRRGFLQKLGLGMLAVPIVARIEVEAQEPEPTHEYAEGMLGRLQRARDEYEIASGEAPGYFSCSNRTRDVLVEELREGCWFGTGPEPALRGGFSSLEVHDMTWVPADPSAPYGIIWVGNELDFFRRGSPWVSHERHMKAHREFVVKNHLHGHITGITSS